ncbi:MAG: Rsd/AlgQ family anti-sigma factor [Parahaliea sp.]
MNNNEQLRESFDAVETLLPDWLRERRALLTAYNKLITRIFNNPPSSEACHEQQIRLCELLIDYVSAGHFEVFVRLLEEADNAHDGSTTLAAELLPAITDTTEVILAYEEKYMANASEDLRERDISVLGETLESRFSLEDRLIAGLHNRHRRLMAPV